MRRVSCIFALILLLPALLLPAGANSEPTKWEGTPASEILVVDGDSPITVSSERLTFDVVGKDSYSLTARVTAAYQMENPTDEALAVQMAFPMEEVPADFNPAGVSITANGAEVPFRLNFGETIYKEYAPTVFDPEMTGTVYTFLPDGKEDDPWLTIEIHDDMEQKIFVNDLYSGSYSSTDSYYTFGLDAEEGITVFAFDGSLDYTVRGGYTLTETEDTFAHYFQSWLGAQSYAGQYDGHWEDLVAQKYMGLNQLWTDCPVVASGWLEQYGRSRQTITLVYTVDFPARSGQEVVVSYLSRSDGLREGTADWQHTFTYLLSPARHWADFGALDITVNANEEFPYVIDSTVPLESSGEQTYTARLDGLPNGDLRFTLYPQPQISAFDRYSAAVNLTSWSFLLLLLLAVVALVLIVHLIRRRRRK